MWLVGAVIVIGSVTFALWPRPETVEQAVNNIMEGYLRLDAERLMKYSIEYEREGLQLDKTKLQPILNYYSPALKGYKRNGPAEIKFEEYEGRCYAVYPIVNGNGKAGQMHISVVKTDDGFKSYVVEHLIFSIWMNGKEPSEELNEKQRKNLALYNGLKRDRAALESMGLPGFVRGLEPKVTPWQSIHDRNVFVLKHFQVPERYW
jgi:hypothetical protein